MDRIKIKLKSDKNLINYVQKFSEYILSETLADQMNTESDINGKANEITIGDFTCLLLVEKSEG